MEQIPTLELNLRPDVIPSGKFDLLSKHGTYVKGEFNPTSNKVDIFGFESGRFLESISTVTAIIRLQAFKAKKNFLKLNSDQIHSD